MAIAIDASSPAIVSNANSAKVTASFTAPADSILVACVSISDATTVTMSNSGTALTWTSRIVRKTGDAGAVTGYAEIFTAPAVSSAARTVTATLGVGLSGGLKVFAVTGADTASPVGATGSGSSSTDPITPTVYTSTVGNSRAFGMGADRSTTTAPTSSDTGFAYGSIVGSGIAVHKAADTTTSGSSVTLNFNGGGASTATWNWVAVEILPLVTAQTIIATGIASAEAVGTAQLNFIVAPSGIASAEAFGSLVISTPLSQSVSPSGITSGEAFGTATLGLFVSPSSIASAEAFGTAGLAAVIGPSGIASLEAFGSTNVAIQQFLTPSSIASDEAFGLLALQLGYPQTIEAIGIESGEVVEDPTASLLHDLVLTNPSIQETPAARNRLFARYGLDRGITIMKDASGVWSSVRYPAQTEIEAAQTTYMGGHRHRLTAAEAEELILAGYGQYVDLELIE